MSGIQRIFSAKKRWFPAFTVLLFLMACASTQREDGEVAAAAPAVKGSADILELLTGFGESISRRNFDRAVAYLVPEERAKILDKDGKVPEDKQKDLMALPLQKLIRKPTVRVENNFLAGIYDQLPSTREKAEAKVAPVSQSLEDMATPAAAAN